mmetsp:Transcript_6353/g.18261  ORF Transcript_6353/g.18261 Transcript_6353/m.18261 type:complete len:314 (-) Transcript_6353:410-1351(-)
MRASAFAQVGAALPPALAASSCHGPRQGRVCNFASARRVTSPPAETSFRCRLVTCAAAEQAEPATPDYGEFDVSSNVVSPVFRSTPWEQEKRKEASSPDSVRVLFVSESNVCRSVLAQAILTELLEANDMAGVVSCESKGSKDYNVGDPPDETLQAVAEELSLRLPEGHKAQHFDHEADIVAYDLVLVFDKFTAADVLREVSVYDTINTSGNYSVKVRMLGEYHSSLAGSKEPDGQDINDPLYGNFGGEEEKEAVQRTAMIIAAACNGLLDFLKETRDAAESSGNTLRAQLLISIGQMDTIDWLVPPMLSKRN